MKRSSLRFAAAAVACAIVSLGADAAWKWAGSYDRATTMLIIGDIDIQLRADPTTAFTHIGETLKHADLVYANLEGMLVKPQGPTVDIPDKRGWRHPGPEGVAALKAWNIPVVGIANNVAYDRKNILETIRVLDANGIIHTGGGRNIDEAHAPAIIERKGVSSGSSSTPRGGTRTTNRSRRRPNQASRRSHRATASRSIPGMSNG